jgi:hypothetical protein
MGVPLFDYKQERGSLVLLLDGAGRQQSAKILGPEEHEEHRRAADRLFP